MFVYFQGKFNKENLALHQNQPTDTSFISLHQVNCNYSVVIKKKIKKATLRWNEPNLNN